MLFSRHFANRLVGNENVYSSYCPPQFRAVVSCCKAKGLALKQVLEVSIECSFGLSSEQEA